MILEEVEPGRNLTKGLNHVRTFVRQFQAYRETPNETIGYQAILNKLLSDFNIDIGKHYEFSRANEIDYGLLVQNISAQESVGDDKGNGEKWLIEVTYSNEVSGVSTVPPNPNPLLRPPVFSFGSSRYTRTVRHDKDGDAVLNSADDYFDPLPTVEEYNGTISVQKNIAGPPQYSWWEDFVGHCNESKYLTFEPRTIALTDLRAEGPFTENQVVFWRITGTFEVRTERKVKVGTTKTKVPGFTSAVLNAGYKVKNKGRCKDDNGADATTPMLLSPTGDQSGDFAPNTVDAGDANYLLYEIMPEADFNNLGLI